MKIIYYFRSTKFISTILDINEKKSKRELNGFSSTN